MTTHITAVCILLSTYVAPSLAASKYFQDSAFSAIYYGTINQTVSETIVGFNTPNINRGNDFNSATGTFTCELPGTYYFEIDVNLADNQTTARLSPDLLFISPADNLVSLSSLNILNSETAGIVDLDIGDQVQLNVPYDLVETFNEDHPLVFSGFLIDHDCHCGGKFTREVSFSVVNIIQPGDEINIGPVTYQAALNNAGECIDPTTGIFTAAYTGTYYFSFTAVTTGVVTFAIQHGTSLPLVITDGADLTFDSLSGSVILELAKGEEVYLQYVEGSPLETVGGSIVFTGFLL